MSFSFNQNVYEGSGKIGDGDSTRRFGGIDALQPHPPRRRSVDDMLDVTSTTKTRKPQPHPEEHNAPRKAPRNFQRKQFHLQDRVWGAIKKDVAANDLQAITERLDRLGLKSKLGTQLLSAPRSSSRFDWYYKSHERQARRGAQKNRLRRTQGREWELRSFLSKKSKQTTEGGREVAMEVHSEGVEESLQDCGDCRRHSR